MRLGTSRLACTCTEISPTSVNFTALLSRFNKICCNRTGSLIITAGVVGVMEYTSSSPFSAARGASISKQRSTVSLSRTGHSSIISRPDSILEKSRTSLIRASSAWELVLSVSANSRCRSSSSVSCSISDRFTIAFSGVRISWLIVLRKAERTWRSALDSNRPRILTAAPTKVSVASGTMTGSWKLAYSASIQSSSQPKNIAPHSSSLMSVGRR